MTAPIVQPFHAVLFPHRSLSRRGFVIVVAIVASVMAFAALRAIALGAWPVAIFAVADVLLVWGALKLNYRSARQFEEVTVTAREVLIRQVNAAGRAVEHRFDPVWARLTVTRRDDEGVTRTRHRLPRQDRRRRRLPRPRGTRLVRRRPGGRPRPRPHRRLTGGASRPARSLTRPPTASRVRSTL